MNEESRSPLRGEVIAPGIFHLNCNGPAPAILNFDLHSAVQADIPGVVRDIQCTVEEARATRVFRRGCYHSASRFFHFLFLAFPLVASPDRSKDELKYS
jgi:hypothetical protein